MQRISPPIAMHAPAEGFVTLIVTFVAGEAVAEPFRFVVLFWRPRLLNAMPVCVELTVTLFVFSLLLVRLSIVAGQLAFAVKQP